MYFQSLVLVDVSKVSTAKFGTKTSDRQCLLTESFHGSWDNCKLIAKDKEQNEKSKQQYSTAQILVHFLNKILKRFTLTIERSFLYVFLLVSLQY